MLVNQGLGVELGAAEHEPDGLDRLVADRREPVRDPRVDRDRVARLEFGDPEPGWVVKATA